MNKPNENLSKRDIRMMALGGPVRSGVARVGSKTQFLPVNCFQGASAKKQEELLDENGPGPFEIEQMDLANLTVYFKNENGQLVSMPADILASAN